tara:strand:- start:299 stop:625 length:327 start_codon:yes stop_codon:yes gene_type:complete
MEYLEIHWLHLVLAYTGMIIHVLMKLGELDKGSDFDIKGFIKKNKWQMIASVLMIPVLLLMATDSSMSEILPLNNVTAVLAGWQTNSTFKALMGIYTAKVKSPAAPDA